MHQRDESPALVDNQHILRWFAFNKRVDDGNAGQENSIPEIFAGKEYLTE